MNCCPKCGKPLVSCFIPYWGYWALLQHMKHTDNLTGEPEPGKLRTAIHMLENTGAYFTLGLVLGFILPFSLLLGLSVLALALPVGAAGDLYLINHYGTTKIGRKCGWNMADWPANYRAYFRSGFWTITYHACLLYMTGLTVGIVLQALL